MQTLISQQEVIDLAFGGSAPFDTDAVSLATIVAAQHKFVRPVVNGLYGKLAEGEYPELLGEYIKPALAHYVKLLMLPTLAAHIGSLGVVRWRGDNFTPADQKYLTALRRATRAEATALMKHAIEHIESRPEQFPEYSAAHNALNHTDISSQIIL